MGPVKLVLPCTGPVYMTKGDDPLAAFAVFGIDSDKLIPSECAQVTRTEQ